MGVPQQWWWTTLTDNVWDAEWRGAHCYADDNRWSLCAMPDYALTDELLDAMEWSPATCPRLLRELWHVQDEDEDTIRPPHCN